MLCAYVAAVTLSGMPEGIPRRMRAANSRSSASSASGEHPLHVFFPHTYAIEPDPKGREWRDVALIPFIDVPALQRHMAMAGPLAPKHAAGQAFGPALAFAFDPRLTEPFIYDEVEPEVVATLGDLANATTEAKHEPPVEPPLRGSRLC